MQAVLDGRKGSFGNDGGKGAGFISHHEEKRGLVGNGVRVVIMSELSKGDVLSPGSRVGATEDPKVSFHFLVNTFSFSIGLRMISSGEGEFVTKEFS